MMKQSGWAAVRETARNGVRRAAPSALALAIAASGGCSSHTESPSAAGSDGPGLDGPPLEPGTAVTPVITPSVVSPLLAELASAQAHTAESLLETHAVSFEPPAELDAASIVGLPLIQESWLALNDAELEQLLHSGFVISNRRQYPSFPYGYTDIYTSDLPVYVTADMILEAVHRSYDEILKQIERATLAPRLTRLLASMRARLASGDVTFSGAAARDADFFLSVAASLLSGTLAPPVAGASSADVQAFVSGATAATGSRPILIFDAPREIDFSQFEPRGHYAGDTGLEQYFRAMTWLGRIDLRLIETLGDGTRVFRRRQLETALALAALLDPTGQDDWSIIDATIGAFVGEHDYMTVPELGTLLAALDAPEPSALAEVPDEAIAQAIIDGQYGAQRIASHIIRKQPSAGGTLPLSASFAFFGQRYTVDSHVFSNVVFDRVPTRVVPDPLDVAFAALGNDHALSLLAPELAQHPYAGALAAMRSLIDAHPADYWQGSLYTSWLSALRALSPRAGESPTTSPAAGGLPAVARTEAWARRLLSTQLASWAELRHDTLLYAKQSYSVGGGCEFPDAYVEPYPELFHAINRLAERGHALALDLASADAEGVALQNRVAAYFTTLASTSRTLAEMAELQRTGMPHSPEHVFFINQAIYADGGSGEPWQTGWYKDLFFDPIAALDLDPTIADVHTDPGGDAPVSRGPSVLHVGTGLPRPMVVTIDTCVGPRAYAGIVFSYHEHREPSLSRLTDDEWQEKLFENPPEVPWLAPALGGQ